MSASDIFLSFAALLHIVYDNKRNDFMEFFPLLKQINVSISRGESIHYRRVSIQMICFTGCMYES